MSHLMRRTYGHGGTRLERILVCAPARQHTPAPLWLKVPLILLLLSVPILVSHYGVPTASLPMRTIIDTSKLTIEPPPPIPPKPETFEPEPEPETPPPTVKRTPLPPPPPALPRVSERTPRRLTVTPQYQETERPDIRRSAAPDLAPMGEYQPRVARERRQVEVEGGTAPAARFRRGATPGEAPSVHTSISRTRGATAMDSSISREQVAVTRRATPAGELAPWRGGSGTAQRPTVVRSGRGEAAFLPEESARPVSGVASRERSRIGESSGSGASVSSVGVVRGVSLMSLEICSSSQQQEEAIKAVLSAVGSRQSCRSDKGEFQFRGTKRVSSFNLIIFPSQGRKPSHRCEELENAYTCLKNQ